MLIAATTGQATWYLSRGTGVVTLILLTMSVVLGIVDVRRWQSPSWPRFVIDALHRNVSLIVVAVLAIHVLTSIVDGYAPISVLDAFIPFTGAYRPIWVGLGAVALDLLVAVALTSVVRQRIGLRAWRAVHWLAYACWPLALVHGLATGSDTKAIWVLVLTAACAVVVIAATAIRTAAGWPGQRGVRSAAMAGLALGTLLLVVWLPGGPLGSGWAARAGTPASLLAATRVAAPAPRPAPRGSGPATGADLAGPFSAGLTGDVRQGQTAAGDVAVDLVLNLSGPGTRRLEVLIRGPAAPGGGVEMTSSAVTLGTTAQADLYRGTVRALRGNQIVATVTRADGHALSLQITLSVSAGGATATGTITAQPLTR